jgi:sugar/nucleoside kinase (ribokinase family)
MIDYLVIGHICKDLLPDRSPNGYSIGGTVAYSALTARNLGQRVAIVTSASHDFDFRSNLDGVLVSVQNSSSTTTFENIYSQGTRRQFLRDVADRIWPKSVPNAWCRAAIVHLGPLAQEIDESLVELFPNSLLAATPQGWMRQWDAAGQVGPKRWDETTLPVSARVVIFSKEDVGDDESRFEACAHRFEIAIMTDGCHGATVAWRGEARHFPAYPTIEIDPTGAGDIFAAAFLVAFSETGDAWHAARFANCAGAASVARPGLAGIPTPEELSLCRVTHLCDPS